MQKQNGGFDWDSQELNLFFQFSSDLIFILDQSGTILRMNRTASEALGDHSDELPLKSLQSCLLPPDLQKFQSFLGGQELQAELRFVKKDGSFIWLLCTLCRIPGEQTFVLKASDLTQIKAKNERLDHLRVKLLQVVREGKVGYWEVNFSTGKLWVSDNIREWWGLSPGQEMTNELYHDLIHPDDRNLMIEIQKTIVETRKPMETIHRTRKPDGSYIWINGMGHPMIDEQGNLIGLMGTSTDITAKMELEAALKIQQAKMMASSRLSAIGEMASGMAHEINNPLAIIQLNAEALREQVLSGNCSPEIIQMRAQKISQTAVRISRIIKSLRTLSRDGESDPLEPTSARRILEETLEICQQKFLNGEILFKVHLPPEELMILSRPIQISQVLLNLLNNAYDAIENLRERWIEVSIRSVNTSVEFVVRDSGTGIPLELHEKIFDPFYTTKDPSKGTGLGLSVSRSLVASHSGALQINPKSQHTEFIVRLPRFAQLSSRAPAPPVGPEIFQQRDAQS